MNGDVLTVFLRQALTSVQCDQHKQFRAMYSQIIRELHLFLMFSWRDWSVSVIPASIQAVGAIGDIPLHAGIRGYVLLMVWTSLYIYGFNIFTQLLSIEEDSINKPDRPLPAKVLTVTDTWKRCIIVWLCFLSLPIMQPQILWETIFHVFFTLFLGATRVGGHWLAKSCLAMGTGSFTLLSASRKLLSPPVAKTDQHMIAISVWVALITQAQDFRDQEGDKRTGRQTLPLVFGDTVARYLQAVILLPTAYVTVCALHVGALSPTVIGILHVLIIYRTLIFRSKEADHTTYMVCVVLIGEASLTNSPANRCGNHLADLHLYILHPNYFEFT